MECNKLSFTEALTNIVSRISSHVTSPDFKSEALYLKIGETEPGAFDYFQQFSRDKNLTKEQQIILATALVPYTHPPFLYPLAEHSVHDTNDFMGVFNDSESGVTYATVQTLLYVLYGRNYSTAVHKCNALLKDELFCSGTLCLLNNEKLVIKNNRLQHIVFVSDDSLSYFLSGENSTPKFSASFPAQKITTKLNWEDLVLDTTTMAQIREITSWHKHRDVVLNQWNLNKMLNPGYKVLFYGPPGTGKTLTAAMMGQELGVDVFRVDLSMVVSKYIGETEKNLSTLFDRAMNKNWILFFDEADALFGNRTEVKDSHDRYANQEVSYLLQRVENYNGIIILASNLKGNMDKAFSRRFQSMVKFKIPDVEQRKKFWANSFSPATTLENNFSLQELAKTYELAGGSIINVVQYASLKAAERGNNVILYSDVKNGVIRELAKDGKTP